MASYLEIRNMYQRGSALWNRTETSVVVAIEMIRADEDGAGSGFSQDTGAKELRDTWAQQAMIVGPGPSVSTSILSSVLAQNRDLTVEQIESATDDQLQTAANKAVDQIAGN